MFRLQIERKHQKEGGRIMKKVVCLLMMCLLVFFFGLGSDALAGKKKIVVVNSEWQIQGTGKMYACIDADTPAKFASGDYIGSMIGAVGLAEFGESDEVSTGTIAPVMITNPAGQPAILAIGSLGVYNLESYSLKKNTVKSTSGNVCIEDPFGGVLEEYPDGACDNDGVFDDINAVFKFTKKGTFTGSVRFRNTEPICVDKVISVSGKLLGTFSDE